MNLKIENNANSLEVAVGNYSKGSKLMMLETNSNEQGGSAFDQKRLSADVAFLLRQNDDPNHVCRCNSNGYCRGTQCVCQLGWGGSSCEMARCPNDCSNRGQCMPDASCKCEQGYGGIDCSYRACPDPTCSGHGVCRSSDGICSCYPGFTGEACSELEETGLGCPDNCNNHGICRDSKCYCDSPWTGRTCNQRICPDNCNGRGKCLTDTHTCECESPWHGDGCELKRCQPKCLNGGICDGYTGRCKCRDGWWGDDCSKKYCPNDCSFHGKCIVYDADMRRKPTLKAANGSATDSLPAPKVARCACDKGWKGKDCSEPDCGPLWTGDRCADRRCWDDCNGPQHGFCNTKRNFTCECVDGWVGKACNLRPCIDNCNGHGTCRNGTCHCSSYWDGEACEIPTCPLSCGKGVCTMTILPGPSRYQSNQIEHWRHQQDAEKKASLMRFVSHVRFSTRRQPKAAANGSEATRNKAVKSSFLNESFHHNHEGTSRMDAADGTTMQSADGGGSNSSSSSRGSIIGELSTLAKNLSRSVVPELPSPPPPSSPIPFSTTGRTSSERPQLGDSDESSSTNSTSMASMPIIPASNGIVTEKNSSSTTRRNGGRRSMDHEEKQAKEEPPLTFDTAVRLSRSEMVAWQRAREGSLEPYRGLFVDHINSEEFGTAVVKRSCSCDYGYGGPTCAHKFCPNDCSGHGMCHQGTCYCDVKGGWSGSDCSVHRSLDHTSTLPTYESLCERNCVHGKCVISSSTSANGSIVVSSSCLCDPRYTGDDCSTLVTPKCPTPNCNNHGVCGLKGCVCDPGFFGSGCDIYAPNKCPYDCYLR
eukprot:jgi/Bigna1/83795/fgenesh1_pg.115_\